MIAGALALAAVCAGGRQANGFPYPGFFVPQNDKAAAAQGR